LLSWILIQNSNTLELVTFLENKSKTFHSYLRLHIEDDIM
jgi:hypothetical protein